MPNISASPLVSLGIPLLAVLVFGLWMLGVAEAERLLGASAAQIGGRAAIAGLAGLAWARLTLLAAHSGLRMRLLWNVLGVLLLVNIVTIAIAATPVFHAFGPDHLNTFVCRSPFVLLPSVLVMAALLGHVVLFRKLHLLAKLSA